MKSELKIDTRVRSLRSYLDEFEKGSFQIPSFQRNFLWDVEAIIQLFDSIKNRYPIGSIQFWQPIEDGEAWIENGIKIGPYQIRNVSEDPKPIFILDGLQRLSALFGCLINPLKYNKDRLKLDETILNEKFRIYYDLETEEFFSLRKKTTPKNYQVPLYVLISTSDFRKWERENVRKIENGDKIELYLDRADELSKIIGEYEIASVDIRNAKVEEAVEIFWRVNSKGLDMSKDWIVNALTNRNDFRLQDELDSLLERLKRFNFNEIKRDILFNCIVSSFGKIYFDQDVVKLVKENVEEFTNKSKKTISNIEKAVQFLFENVSVIHQKALPSSFQLIYITEFFNIIKKPTPKQLAELKEWFWITSYSNYFTLYNAPSRQSKVFNQFRNYFSGGNSNLYYNETPELKFYSPKYKYSTFGSTRFCTNVLFQISQTNDNIPQDNCLGFESIKLIGNEEASLGNMVHRPIMVNDALINYRGKVHTDFSFMLTEKFQGQYEELFITDEMRNLYAAKRNKDIINMREKLICQKEKAFVESLGIEYE